MPEGKLTVAVIAPSRARAAIVEEGLRRPPLLAALRQPGDHEPERRAHGGFARCPPRRGPDRDGAARRGWIARPRPRGARRPGAPHHEGGARPPDGGRRALRRSRELGDRGPRPARSPKDPRRQAGGAFFLWAGRN